MTLDLDRSILPVRVGQKPYFVLDNDKLELKGLPINPNPEIFFSTHPPNITSYLFRRLLYGNLLPKEIASFLRRDKEHVRKKKEVNQRIILEIVKELRNKGIDYVFLIFHPHWPGVAALDEGETDWRSSFLMEILDRHQIPFIWSKTIFKQDRRKNNHSYEDYINPGHGHPTTYFNKLIADEIKNYALKNQNSSS